MIEESAINVYNREWRTVKRLLYTHPESQKNLDAMAEKSWLEHEKSMSERDWNTPRKATEHEYEISLIRLHEDYSTMVFGYMHNLIDHCETKAVNKLIGKETLQILLGVENGK